MNNPAKMPVANTKPCHTCRGGGAYDGERCPACNGTGIHKQSAFAAAAFAILPKAAFAICFIAFCYGLLYCGLKLFSWLFIE